MCHCNISIHIYKPGLEAINKSECQTNWTLHSHKTKRQIFPPSSQTLTAASADGSEGFEKWKVSASQFTFKPCVIVSAPRAQTSEEKKKKRKRLYESIKKSYHFFKKNKTKSISCLYNILKHELEHSHRIFMHGDTPSVSTCVNMTNERQRLSHSRQRSIHT